MLTFADMFPEAVAELEKYKVHLAIGRTIKKEPLLQLAKGEFKAWQEYQSRKNFERDYIVSLVYYRPTEWIYPGIYKRVAVQEAYDAKKGKPYCLYTTELLDKHNRPNRKGGLLFPQGLSPILRTTGESLRQVHGERDPC